jgi:L-threonylcarbamoyladenylate synthase
MRQIDREYAESHKDEIVAAIKAGDIFIYPTDTIYGIGCDATNNDSVKKIRELKQREEKPFSIIAPGKDWILELCDVKDLEKLDLLPGPYTLILKWKRESPIAGQVNPNDGTIGVRIPDHWFTKIVGEARVPFVTTSVNISGEKHMESIEEVPEEILSQVDWIVYEGVKKGESSAKINLT